MSVVKTNLSDRLAYGGCKGVFTYAIKPSKDALFEGTYKIYSSDSEFKKLYMDVSGRKGGEVVLTFGDDTPKQVNHYFDIGDCEDATGGFLISESKYIKCLPGHYCPTYRKMEECPFGGTSPGGSASLQDCQRSR